MLTSALLNTPPPPLVSKNKHLAYPPPPPFSADVIYEWSHIDIELFRVPLRTNVQVKPPPDPSRYTVIKNTRRCLVTYLDNTFFRPVSIW